MAEETASARLLAEQLGAALGDGYEVVRPLGEGGFAVVYLVRDLSLKRDLAVKVLSPDLITSRTVLDRFRREAETIAQLSHPNIVPLHFIGQRDDLLYLAMQCVSGGSIGDRLHREGPLPVDDVVRIVTEVASALAYAHKRGVIHRDIKPANVLVDADSGRCLVTDFGIARSADTTKLTSTGVLLGTPAYLSPEQVTGENFDHRVDIYALAVMAYELLAGKVPFEGPNAAAVLMKRLGGPPAPVTEIRKEVPKRIADAITACLAADPAERPQTMDEMIRAFDGTDLVRTTSSKRPSRALMPRVAIGGAALVALGVGGYFFATRQRPAVSPEPTTATNLVAIPAGNYFVGSDAGPAMIRPKHVETVGAFSIEKTEVTVGAYAQYAAATKTPVPWNEQSKPDDRLPVTGVSFGDAQNYCASKYPQGGRLPTEIEWEAAARGEKGRTYSYGDVAEPAAANTESAKRLAPAPVGSFPRSATPEGLQDMTGNVWEWTSSSMLPYPGAPAGSPSVKDARVIRGGAFDTADSIATASWRGYSSVNASVSDLSKTGFRCVAPTTK